MRQAASWSEGIQTAGVSIRRPAGAVRTGALSGRASRTRTLTTSRLPDLEPAVAVVELQLRGQKSKRHDHPEDGHQRQAEVRHIVTEHLAQGTHHGVHVLMEEPDFEDARPKCSFDGSDASLVRCGADDRQHRHGHQQRHDGQAYQRRQIFERIQQAVDKTGDECVQDSHELARRGKTADAELGQNRAGDLVQ